MGSTYANVKRWRKDAKSILMYGFGNGCGECGYNRCSSALEFHHTNPMEKDLSLSAWISVASFDRLAKEAHKCVMLCANCHREVHAGTLLLSSAIHRFSQSAYETARDAVLKERQQLRIAARKPKPTPTPRKYGTWTNVDVWALRDAGLSWSVIGRQAGVSATAVRKRYRTRTGM